MVKISKNELLRRGESVELRPGLTGKLNRKTQTLDLSDGRSLRHTEKQKRDLFPENEEAYLYANEYEGIQEGTKTGLEKFGHQYMQKSIAGAGRDWYDYATKERPDYQRTKKAREEVSKEISKKNPWISRAATVADIGTDVAATIGTGGGILGAAAVGGGLSLAHAGPRILEEPGQALGEAGISTLGGAFVGGLAKGATSIASRRALKRALPAKQEAVRMKNAAESLRVENENSMRQHQFNVDLNERKNRLMQHENEIKQKKIDRDIEVERIKNETGTWTAEDKLGVEKRNQEIKRLEQEYEFKNQQYKEDLRKIPELQRKAQAEHSQNVQKTVNEIVATIPAETRINSDLIGVSDFIGEKITPTSMGGTKESSQVSKILNSLFPEGESFTAKELGKKYELLEGAIQDSHPAVSDYLSRFKEHLADRLPRIISENAVHSKIMPVLEKQIEKGITASINKMSFGLNGAAKNSLIIKANKNLRILLQQIGPEKFVEKLNSGEIANTLNRGILSLDDFMASAGLAKFSKLKKSSSPDMKYFREFQLAKDAEKAHKDFVSELTRDISEVISKNEFKATEIGENVNKRLGESLKKTLGMAPKVESPISPHASGSPQNPLPPEYVAPQRTPTPEPPPVVETPFSEPLPNEPRPIPQPTGIQDPQMPPAQGFAEHAGDFLEKPMFGGGNARGTNILKNPLTQLAGGLTALKFLPGAKAAAVGYGVAKGLTSPTAAGAAARMTFRQGGIQAIISWAQKYPSYHDGILEDPQERRSLSKEIEDDPDMTIEEKAIAEAKNHRGKRLDGNLF